MGFEVNIALAFEFWTQVETKFGIQIYLPETTEPNRTLKSVLVTVPGLEGRLQMLFSQITSSSNTIYTNDFSCKYVACFYYC